MANIDEKYFEKFKKEIIESNNALDDFKNKFSDIKNIENELIEIQGLFGRREMRLLAELNTKAKTTLGLTNDEKKIRDELLALQEKYNDLTEKNKINQQALNKAFAAQNRELREGYGWIDKFQNKLSENGGNAFLKGFREIKYGALDIYKAIKKLAEPWSKADQAASNYAKSIGLSQKGMRQLRNDSINFVHSQAISSKYNKSIDELIKLQQSYASKVGRSISMTNKQKESLAAISSVMGDEMAADLTAKLENFGLSATEAGDRVGKMFSSATKKGLSFESISKNFLENIKIAQNYTFSNGLRGLASMAEKATAIKLNMSQASSFADKVSTVEGAIKTGAQLQVLGGTFAQYANPMNMLYESLNDLEGLQDRIVNMFGSLGTFNKETGEMKISAFNRLRIKQAAQATGMDYNNLFDMINTKGKRNAMGNLERQYGFTKDIQELLYNKATYNNETKQWGISGTNGKFIALDELKSRPDEINNLINVSKSESEDIKDIAQLLRSWNDSISGLGKQYDAAKAKGFSDLKIGDKLIGLINDIGSNVEILKNVMWALLGINIGKGLFNIFKGFSRLGKGLKGLSGMIGNLGNKNIIKNYKAPTVLDNIGRNKSGKLIYTSGKNKGQFVSKNLLDDIVDYRRQDLAKNGGKIGRRGIGRALPRLATKLGGKTGLKVLSKVGKFGGIATAGLADAVLTGINEFGGDSNHSTAKKIGRTVGTGIGGIAGALIGSFLGPLGTIAGGYLGSELGKWIGGGFSNDRRRNKKKNEFGLNDLKGDYSAAQLKRIKRYIDSGGDSNILKKKDINALKENGEYGIISQKVQMAKMVADSITIMSPNPIITSSNYTNEFRMAKGGLLNGPSHANGGMKIEGTNKSVEGGEFIVNKNSTKKYFSELKSINSDVSPIKPIEPMGKILKVTESISKDNSIYRNPEIKIQPIDINFNGSIKVDIGNKNIDITRELINSPSFIKSLTDLITKQININATGSFNKEQYRQKWNNLM